MKTRDEIRIEARRLEQLAESHAAELRGPSVADGGPGVLAPSRVLFTFPMTAVGLPALNDADAQRRRLTWRWIEAEYADDRPRYLLMAESAEASASRGPVDQVEAFVEMKSPSAEEVLRAGYEAGEEERLAELLAPYVERIDEVGADHAVDDGHIGKVEAIIEAHLLSPAAQLRTRAEIVEFLEGRLEAGEFIAHAIERQCAREDRCEVQTQRHEMKLMIDEP